MIFRAREPDVVLARAAVAEVHGRAPVDEAALSRFLSDPKHYLLLAVEEGRVVGSLNGYSLQPPHRPEPQFLLYEIDVRPEDRNRGIGTALVREFIREARLAGASEVWVLSNESNTHAMRLYAHCGMRRGNSDDVMFSLAMDEPSG